MKQRAATVQKKSPPSTVGEKSDPTPYSRERSRDCWHLIALARDGRRDDMMEVAFMELYKGNAFAF